jgi:hypothetical protein
MTTSEDGEKERIVLVAILLSPQVESDAYYKLCLQHSARMLLTVLRFIDFEMNLEVKSRESHF